VWVVPGRHRSITAIFLRNVKPISCSRIASGAVSMRLCS
jgi:hypothetical protein